MMQQNVWSMSCKTTKNEFYSLLPIHVRDWSIQNSSSNGILMKNAMIKCEELVSKA